MYVGAPGMPRLLLPPSASALLLLLLLPHTAAAASPCADAHPECFLWANMGECEANQHVRVICAPSCGLCVSSTAASSSSAPHVAVLGSGRSHEPYLPFEEGSDAVVSMTAGELHLVLLLASGAVLTFGDDSMGQLGQPQLSRRMPLTRRSPGRVLWPAPFSNAKAVAVAAGRMYSGALLESGQLMLWGENTHSQCGIPAQLTPMHVAPPELSALSAIAAMPMRGACCVRLSPPHTTSLSLTSSLSLLVSPRSAAAHAHRRL